uniref:Uncharacterized protein n=1 Tax=Anguilla anguilla TaxID=7936 RepID=A0A0E9QRM3_ANGAN
MFGLERNHWLLLISNHCLFYAMVYWKNEENYRRSMWFLHAADSTGRDSCAIHHE